MRVRKTDTDEPAARRKSEMVRDTQWRAVGSAGSWLKCEGSTCGRLKQAGIHLVKTSPIYTLGEMPRVLLAGPPFQTQKIFSNFFQKNA